MEKDKFGHLSHDALVAIDPSYSGMDSMIELKPVRVTVLSPGTFQRYYLEKQAEGVDLAFLKPPHMNLNNSMVEVLLRLSKAA